MTLYNFVFYASHLIIIYFLMLGSWYILTLITSMPDIHNSFIEAHYGNLYSILQKEHYVPVTIIIPAYNAEKIILNAIYSVIYSKYKNVQIVIVNDGSTDNTLELLIKEFDLFIIPPVIKHGIQASQINNLYNSNKYANLFVIDKVHSVSHNAADANNSGLNFTTSPVYITLDADTIVAPDAITNILAQFLIQPDVVSAGGALYILNDNIVEKGRLVKSVFPKRFVVAFQTLEYLRAFTYGRSGLNAFSGSMCHSGAFTLNDTQRVREVKGYDNKDFAYDVDLTMKLHTLMENGHHAKMRYSTNAIGWTIVPDTWKAFWIQRDKWQRGMMLSLKTNFRMLFNWKYGVAGTIVFPSYILFDIGGPLIEFISYFMVFFALYLGIFSFYNILWFILCAWSYLVFMTLYSFYLNMITYKVVHNLSTLRIIWIVTVEMCGFRQFRAGACFYGTLHYFYNRLRGRTL